MRQGDIIVCTLTGDYGKPRPAVILQSDLFNATHASVVICPITSHLIDAPLFRITIPATHLNNLKCDSQIMADKLITIKKEKIAQQIGKLSKEEMQKVKTALKLWLTLGE